MTQFPEWPDRLNIDAIEREARRMRAETISKGASAFRAWIARQFSARPARGARPQHGA